MLGSSFSEFISKFGNPFSSGKSTGILGLSDSTLSSLGGLAALALSPSGFGLGGSFFGGSNQPVGYQGKIPEYTATRSRVPNTYDPTRRPGSSGQRYFTDTQFVPKVEGEAPATPMSAEGLAALNLANPARQTIPQKEVTSVAPATVAPTAASGVVDLLPVPTTFNVGGAVDVQEQARRDAEALGISLDEYYDLGFLKRLGLAAKDIKEVADPSLGDAQNLGILSFPKPPAPAPAPVPEITQENLPKYRPPSIQKTTTANRPESLTLEDQMGINQGKMTTYPKGAGIGPEMRNEDFMAQLELINQGRPPAPKGEAVPLNQGRPPAPKGEAVPSIRTGTQTGVPPKPKLRLDKDTAKNQRERKAWEKQYGEDYNDDGTLKTSADDQGFLERLLGLLGQSYGASYRKGLATGGMLDGATDGMADKVPAMIDNTDPAALSDGEYVITADVVSHLGNGNSDAGAEVLDGFMENVRKARTGTKKQAPEINPQKFLPKT